MELKKSLLALGVSSVIMAGVCTTAAAQTAEEDDSVYRWGRWAVLAPAAGPEEVIAFSPPGSNDLGRCESAANCPSPINGPQNNPNSPGETPPGEEPPVATGPCQAGMPCGFARIDYRVSGSSQPSARHVGLIDLSLVDGRDTEDASSVAFSITGPSAPDGEVVNLNSETLSADVGDEGFRSTARGSLSSISGRITRDQVNDVAVVEGPWRQIGPAGAFAHGGEFVWGLTATADQMSALMGQLSGGLGGDLVAAYTGATATGGTINLDFNFSNATWAGTVSGTVMTFDAGGVINNSNFVSDAGQFSPNVATGDLQGAFVNAGNNAIGSFEVVDQGGLREADVFNTTLQNPLVQPAL